MGRVSDARQRLVQAATDLLWQQSYGAVSVDDICERAGVKKGSFYHFFPSKDDLVMAALDENWDERRAQLDTLFSPTHSPLERLSRYFDSVYRRQVVYRRESGRVVGCFYQNLGAECVDQKRISNKVQEILATYLRYYESTLREAQAAGLIRIKDPAEMARSLFAYMEGVLVQARSQNDLTIVRNLRRTALEFLGVEDAPRSQARPE